MLNLGGTYHLALDPYKPQVKTKPGYLETNAKSLRVCPEWHITVNTVYQQKPGSIHDVRVDRSQASRR